MQAIAVSSLRFRDLVRPGEVISWPQGTGEPVTLVQALVAQRHELQHARLFVGMRLTSTLRPEHVDAFQISGLNGAGTNRQLTAAGVIDLLPMHVSGVTAAIRARRIPIDVVLVPVRPDGKGRYSVGPMADYVRAMVENARLVIGELNENLPLTAQDAVIEEADIDVLVRSQGQVVELADPEPADIDVRVASHVAALVPDGATVQFGIGSLPVAVARALSGHRDLGVHSGVISDAVVDLIEKGVVTNARKGLDTGVSVTGGLFGTRRLYDFADGNPALHLRSVDHTHSQAVLGTLHALHAVNGAVEVDLSGQINAETAAGRYLGAVGGQVDFVRGALSSPGGKSIIALPSATPDESRSRIVPRLAEAVVTTPRSDAGYVVTEYGAADLRDQTLAERARRLIAVAHPKFRDELWRECRPVLVAGAVLPVQDKEPAS
ncbi:acetyl-CoA hydrolase [Agaricicola taiwanensis]|uniref:Acetyl-CoA hydrolase n=1 Tax=Agaricicola taiwanensis TaxID=591372 RepID=A0A8J2YIX2_9RHOB|nr:acetyl-CoA hydrolase/transferase C-terminal domain-containing protein [Agaricicola taiwanensis]GGE45546.1 acetyl-CoA hydrolase [Agaricicola taiwanensis]